ncbi:hypothetical protein NKJ46_27605 [Mesorhizobium sp. M0166]|uniref:sunset domain-containing protein n=1 Tax=unclassified Mesorhizobium TaxID=325217 RepID=UPI0033395A3B
MVRHYQDTRYNRARYRRRRHRSDGTPLWAKIATGGAVLAGLLALELAPAAVGCGIKGNISYNTGEKIYHVPGQEYYRETRINLLKGERWFCSEEAARKAGWRKSRV